MTPVSPRGSAAHAPLARSDAPHQRLQHSLSRLSTAPADTGTASQLSASAQRLVSDFAAQDDLSRLQHQDATLHQVSTLLSRLSELKSLDTDPAASDTDRAGYQTEFASLQEQLSTLAEEPFNGNPLIHSPLARTTTPHLDATAENSSLEYATTFADDFSNADHWESTASELSVSDHTFYPTSGSYGAVQTKQAFSGAMEIQFDLFLPGTVDSLDVSVGDTHLSNLTDALNINKWEWHRVRIAYDGAGTAATYLDGSDTAADTQTGLTPASGRLSLANLGLGSAWIKNFSVTATGTGPAAPATTSPASPLSDVIDASDLHRLDAQSLDDAAEEIARLQADNDEEMNPLTSASGQTADTAETEDSLTDGDQAVALTEFTRQQILQDSMSVLLAQANVDGGSALLLLG